MMKKPKSQEAVTIAYTMNLVGFSRRLELLKKDRQSELECQAQSMECSRNRLLHLARMLSVEKPKRNICMHTQAASKHFRNTEGHTAQRD